MMMLKLLVAVVPLALVTRTVNDVVCLRVGVPEMTPVPECSVSPRGSLPDAMAQEYGSVPPVALNCALYATLTLPAGREAVVMETGETRLKVTVLSLLVEAVLELPAAPAVFVLRVTVSRVTGLQSFQARAPHSMAARTTPASLPPPTRPARSLPTSRCPWLPSG